MLIFMKPTEPMPLEKWLDTAAATGPAPWHTLPEIELYMDQVLSLINRPFEVLSVPTDRPLTSSMVNNYVKDKVVPAPVKKKYTRDHLTALYILCMLKSEFSLPEIRSLMEGLSETLPTEELYTAFAQAQDACLQEAVAAVRQGLNAEKSEQYKLAMALALEANAKRLVAARLLDSLSEK